MPMRSGAKLRRRRARIRTPRTSRSGFLARECRPISTVKKIAPRMTTAAELVRQMELRDAEASLGEFLADKRGDTDFHTSKHGRSNRRPLRRTPLAPIVAILNDAGRIEQRTAAAGCDSGKNSHPGR